MTFLTALKWAAGSQNRVSLGSRVWSSHSQANGLADNCGAERPAPLLFLLKTVDLTSSAHWNPGKAACHPFENVGKSYNTQAGCEEARFGGPGPGVGVRGRRGSKLQGAP